MFSILLYTEIYRVAQRSKPQTLVHIVANDRFSNLFHWHVLWQICNKMVTKYTTPAYFFGPPCTMYRKFSSRSPQFLSEQASPSLPFVLESRDPSFIPSSWHTRVINFFYVCAQLQFCNAFKHNPSRKNKHGNGPMA